jgi:hypothetical protein
MNQFGLMNNQSMKINRFVTNSVTNTDTDTQESPDELKDSVIEIIHSEKGSIIPYCKNRQTSIAI